MKSSANRSSGGEAGFDSVRNRARAFYIFAIRVIASSDMTGNDDPLGPFSERSRLRRRSSKEKYKNSSRLTAPRKSVNALGTVMNRKPEQLGATLDTEKLYEADAIGGAGVQRQLKWQCYGRRC